LRTAHAKRHRVFDGDEEREPQAAPIRAPGPVLKGKRPKIRCLRGERLEIDSDEPLAAMGREPATAEAPGLGVRRRGPAHEARTRAWTAARKRSWRSATARQSASGGRRALGPRIR